MFLPSGTNRNLLALWLCLIGASRCVAAAATEPSTAPAPPIAAADISALAAIEKAGGIYRENGQPKDAIQTMRDHGYNLFRVRLFVKPNTNTGGPGGAIQDMNYIRPLVKRVKASGAQLDLDLHYSDTWADPGKQFKPADWANLDFDALVQKVHDYTADVLKQLAADGTSPDIVQIGNEITAGMIWPDGKVGGVPEAQRAEQWAKFSRLLNAGAKAVREAQTPSHKIRVMIHIDNGGKAGTPQNFFRQLSANPVDFDIIGLSFYPEWGGSMPALKQNMSDIIGTYHKDVIIAETSYFWKPMTLGKYDTSMLWPETPAGQKQFTADLAAVINAAPEHHGLGFIWWYPESINLPNRRMWRSGADALWDDTGNALPALTELFTAPATQP